jgi:hypothetical protein
MGGGLATTRSLTGVTLVPAGSTDGAVGRVGRAELTVEAVVVRSAGFCRACAGFLLLS